MAGKTSLAAEQELVRAKMPNGGINNVRRSYAERKNLEILGPAADGAGRIARAKPKIALAKAGGEVSSTGDALQGGTQSGSTSGSGSAEATS